MSLVDIMTWAYGLNVLVPISHFLMLEHLTKCDLALASNFFCPESVTKIKKRKKEKIRKYVESFVGFKPIKFFCVIKKLWC
jgi:hypothetical protein